MIISHKYKYLFVEMNHTASTAISDELCSSYDGANILWKHARYRDFLAQAGASEKGYFCFSGKRNPLDIVVTLYFRHKYDGDRRFCDITTANTTIYNYKLYRFISQTNADFPAFFKKFFLWRIYYEWKADDFKRLGHVYRYEELQTEFSELLSRLGLEQVRPLPVVNKTDEKKPDFASYYDKDIQAWSIIILRDMMRRWGYDFPTYFCRPSWWQWLYYWLCLKPLFLLRRLFHLIIDHPSLFSQLYVTDVGWIGPARRWYKSWRKPSIDKSF